MEIATWQATVSAGASIATAGFAFLVVAQIRQSRLSRDATVTIDMSRRWDEGLVRRARHRVNQLSADDLRDTMERARRDKILEYYTLIVEPNYYEDLAILCRHKAIDLELVRESLGETITGRWKKWKPAVMAMRKRDAQNYRNFEWLADEMTKPPPPSLRRFSAWLREPAFDIELR